MDRVTVRVDPDTRVGGKELAAISLEGRDGLPVVQPLPAHERAAQRRASPKQVAWKGRSKTESRGAIARAAPRARGPGRQGRWSAPGAAQGAGRGDIAIARALALDPKVMLFDGPT